MKAKGTVKTSTVAFSLFSCTTSLLIYCLFLLFPHCYVSSFTLLSGLTDTYSLKFDKAS